MLLQVKARATKTKPFHFASDRKRKLEGSEPPAPAFVPLAEAVNNFHKMTPARFRRTRKGTDQGTSTKGTCVLCW